MKKKRSFLLAFLLLIGISGLVFYFVNARIGKTYTEEFHTITEENWLNFNPFEFATEDIISIAYIKDRSGLGEETNLCWYIEDEKDIKAIVDGIDQDISFSGYKDRKNIPDGEKIIILWFELKNGDYHRVLYSSSRLAYEGKEYEIVTGQNLLADAWWKVLQGYQPMEVIGTENPYADTMDKRGT